MLVQVQTLLFMTTVNDEQKQLIIAHAQDLKNNFSPSSTNPDELIIWMKLHAWAGGRLPSEKDFDQSIDRGTPVKLTTTDVRIIKMAVYQFCDALNGALITTADLMIADAICQEMSEWITMTDVRGLSNKQREGLIALVEQSQRKMDTTDGHCYVNIIRYNIKLILAHLRLEESSSDILWIGNSAIEAGKLCSQAVDDFDPDPRAESSGEADALTRAVQMLYGLQKRIIIYRMAGWPSDTLSHFASVSAELKEMFSNAEVPNIAPLMRLIDDIQQEYNIITGSVELQA